MLEEQDEYALWGNSGHPLAPSHDQLMKGVSKNALNMLNSWHELNAGVDCLHLEEFKYRTSFSLPSTFQYEPRPWNYFYGLHRSHMCEFKQLTYSILIYESRLFPHFNSFCCASTLLVTLSYTNDIYPCHKNLSWNHSL